ncbi:hypothetical protein ACFS7Z_22120 [Pontibacter toksunensis]|uniref:Uncharacterized protein n=1 Tax=Pontibacter toksunensis TaxID=1332631 RepID=A0ABW6C4J3_9BACT
MLDFYCPSERLAVELDGQGPQLTLMLNILMRNVTKHLKA